MGFRSSLLLPLLASLARASTVWLWNTTKDDHCAVDATIDLGLADNITRTSFLHVANTTLESVQSNSDIRYFFNWTGNDQNAVWLMPSYCKHPDTNESFILYSSYTYSNFSNFAIYGDVRNFTSGSRSFELMGSQHLYLNQTLDQVIGNPNDLAGTRMQTQGGGLVATCLDARNLAKYNKIMVVCKLYRKTTDYAKMSALIYILTFDMANATKKDYTNFHAKRLSSEYRSNTSYVQTIHWGQFFFDSSVNPDELVYITDIDYNSTNFADANSTHWILVVAGYNYSLKTTQPPLMIVSKKIKNDKDPNTLMDLRYNLRMVSTSSLCIAGSASTSNRNLILLTAFVPTVNSVPAHYVYCWHDIGTSYTTFLDDNSTNYTFVCHKETTTELVYLEKVANMSKDTTLVFRVKSELSGLSYFYNVTYEVLKMKPVDIAASTSNFPYQVSHVMNTTFDKNHGNFSARIVVVRPDELFYVCWILRTTLNPEMNDCAFIDLFQINMTKYDPAQPNSISQIFSLIRREYGPFITLAFDYNITSNTTSSMLAFKRYPNHIEIDAKALVLYNLSLQSYSIKLPEVNFTTTPVPFLNLNSNNISLWIRTIPSSILYYVTPPGINISVVPFKKSFPNLVDVYTDRLFVANPAVSVSASDSSPKIIDYWQHSLTYTPDSSLKSSVIINDRVIEFYTQDGKHHLLMKGLNLKIESMSTVSTLSDNKYSVATTFVLGDAFVSTNDMFTYTYFKKAEMTGTGLYLYFNKASGYGVVRFDKNRYTAKFFSNQGGEVKVFESKSLAFIFCIHSTAPASLKLYVTEENHGKWNLTEDLTKIDRQYWINLTSNTVIKSLDDVYLDTSKGGNCWELNIVANDKVSLFSSESFLSNWQFTWSNYTIKTGNIGPSLNFKKIIDTAWEKTVFGNSRCVYKESTFFWAYDTSNSSNHTFKGYIFNSTKRSHYPINFDMVTEAPMLRCFNEFAVFMIKRKIGGSTKELVYSVRLDSELKAFTRVRSMFIDMKLDLIKMAGSSNYLTFFKNTGSNSFIMTSNKKNKVYISMGYDQSKIPTTNQSIVQSPDMTLTKPASATEADYFPPEVIKTVQLLKPDHIHKPPVYIGNETLDTQKKIIYLSNENKDYSIEDFYQLPITVFWVSFSTSIKSENIKYLKRIRKVGDADLYKDESTNSSNRCLFSEKGVSDVSMVDDVMLRVETRDDSYCFEVAKVTLNGNGELLRNKIDYLFVQGGMVSQCRLIRDQTIDSQSNLESKQAKGIEYAITCIHKQRNETNLLIVYINLQPSIENYLKLDYLYKLPVNKPFTSYKSIMVINSLYFAFFDEESRQLHYAKQVFTIGTTGDIGFWTLNATSFELYYYPPQANENKFSGIEMLICAYDSVKLDNITFKQYRIMPNQLMSLNTAPSTQFNTNFYNQTISYISCATQLRGITNSVVSCAYLYYSSRNTIFYQIEDPNSKIPENYIAPYNDLEIRQMKIIHNFKEFIYIALALSPLTGQKFLLIYKHAPEAPGSENQFRNASNFMGSDLLMFDSINITDNTIDLDESEITYFYLGGRDYVAFHNYNKMSIFKFDKLLIYLSSGLSFKDIQSTKMQFKDHLGNELSSELLGNFFREKKKATYMWLYILGTSLAITTILVVIYLIFKKKNLALDNEINNRDTDGFERELI